MGININNLWYTDNTTLMTESEEEPRSLLMKEESENVCLKLNIHETSHPRLLPQSPKVCSIHLCLFFYFAYRVITALKHVYYLGWKRSPAQVGCMRQVSGPGVLGRPRGIGQRGRWEGESGWGIHVKPWLILVSVWQKPLKYCKVISLQLIKINGKKKERDHWACRF